MKIQFEIKETLAGILDQLLHSDFWITEVEEIDDKRKLIKIRDFAYPQEATAEVSENEILLKTAWSKYTYRLYEVNHVCWCEYTGAYRGLLEQKLLPIITPKHYGLTTIATEPRRCIRGPAPRILSNGSSNN